MQRERNGYVSWRILKGEVEIASMLIRARELACECWGKGEREGVGHMVSIPFRGVKSCFPFFSLLQPLIINLSIRYIYYILPSL